MKGGGRPRPLNRLQSSLKLPESYNAMLSSSNLRKARGQRCQQQPQEPQQPDETCSALREEAEAGQKKQRREHHEVNWELELTNLSKALVRETSFNLSSSSVSTLSREEHRPITEQQEMLLDFCLEVRDDCKALVLEGSRLARLLTGMHVLCEELSEPQLEVEAIQCTECVMQRARDLVHVVLLNYARLPHLREWPEHKPLVTDLLTTMAQCVDCIRSLLNISGMFAYTKVALPASIFAPILSSASAPMPTEVEHAQASSSTPSFSFVVEEPERTQLFVEEFKARDKYRISKKIKEFCAAFSSLSTSVDKLQNVSFFECTIEGEEDDEDEETKSGSSIQTTNGEEGSEGESGTDLSQSGSDIMVYVTDEDGNKVMKKKEKDEEEQLNKLSGSLVSAFERKMESIQQEQEARQQSLKLVLSARQQQRKRNDQAEAEERDEDEEDEKEEEEAEEEKKAKKKAQIERQIMEDIKASKKKEKEEQEAGKDDAKQHKKEEPVVQKKNQLNKTRGKKKETTTSQTKKKKKDDAGEEDAKAKVPPLSLNKNHKSSSSPSTPTSSSSFSPLHSSFTSTSPSPSSSSSSALRSSSPPASLRNSHDGAENEGEAKDKKRRNSLFSQAAFSLPSIRRSKTKQRIQDDRKGSSLGAVELAMMAFTSPNGQQVSSALLLSPTSPSVASSPSSAASSPKPKSPRSSTSILFSNSFLASDGNHVKERKARERDEKTKNWRRMSLEPTNKRQQQKKKDKKEEKRKEEEEREKLRRWLQSIDPSFIGYADNFLAEKIYLADVVLLEENDLKELLLPLGVRRKVYLKVKEEKKKMKNNNNSDDDNNSSSEERSQGQGMKSKERRKKKKSHSERKRSSAKQGMREDFASMCAIKVEDLMVEKKLGNGAFGDVLKAVWRQTTTVAVKRMRSDLLMDENHRKDFINEMRVMMSMPRHPNIVGMLGGCMSNKGKELLLVMEYVSDGGVREYLQQHPTDVGNLQLLQLAMGIAAGMDHLEANNVIHRDLSLRNILLEIRGTQREYIAKVSDFGLAKKTLSDRRRTLMEESQRGTLIGGPVRRIPLRWTAPEAIESNKFTFKSDVWSFGIVLWELYSFGDTPFSALGVGSNTLDTEALLRHLKEGYRMPRPEECPEEVYKIMTDCWSLLPQFRPTFKDICLKLQAIWKRTLEQQKLLLNHRQAPSPTPTIPVVVIGSNHLSTAPSPSTEDAKQKQNVTVAFPSSSSSCDDEIYIE
ncbi:vascular endothelial growth factor receptor 1 [Balamuthia mandrillaris]